MASLPAYDLFSKQQQAILAYLPLLSAPLSLAGSIVIVFVVFTDKRTKIETYQRLMIGLSLLSGLSSFGMIALGPWALPDDVAYSVGARGNIQSCTAAGAFLQLLFGSMWFSFFLSVYFCLLIRCGWPKRKIARYMEPVAYLFVFISAFLNSLGAITMNWINPWYVLPGWCWSQEYPPGCGGGVTQVPCTRGKNAAVLVSGVMVLFVWIGIIICMTMLVRKVEQTEARLHQYAGGANNNFERTRETRIQSLYYIGAFFIVYFPLAAILLMPRHPESTDRNRRLYFAFAFLVKLLTPLQGFFNAFIYLRQRILSLIRERLAIKYFKAWFSPVHSASTAPNSITIECDGRHPDQAVGSAYNWTGNIQNKADHLNIGQSQQEAPGIDIGTPVTYENQLSVTDGAVPVINGTLPPEINIVFSLVEQEILNESRPAEHSPSSDNDVLHKPTTPDTVVDCEMQSTYMQHAETAISSSQSMVHLRLQDCNNAEEPAILPPPSQSSDDREPSLQGPDLHECKEKQIEDVRISDQTGD